jgi:hypothetical protein
MCPYRDKITKLVRLVRIEQPDDRPLASQTDPGRRRADLSLTDLGNFSARYSGPRVRNRVTAIGRMVKRRWPYVSTFCMETLNTRHDQLPLLGIEIYGSREFEEQRVLRRRREPPQPSNQSQSASRNRSSMGGIIIRLCRNTPTRQSSRGLAYCPILPSERIPRRWHVLRAPGGSADR